jgi:DNA-binding SARP family transcriptional activator
VESALSGVAPLEIRLFGPVSIWKGGGRRELPPSRKVRALLAYLALAPHPVARAHLCEIFWDVPNDPRGELRWTLSKLRAILDESTRSRVITKSGAVSLDLADAWIDAVAVARAVEDLDTLPLPRVCALADAAGEGEFLSGLEIEGSPAFNGWLAAQRRTFRRCSNTP